MSTDTVTLFLALLAIVAELGVFATLACLATGRLKGLRIVIAYQQAIGLGLLVAAVSTAGSLYFSELAHFPPCHLGWAQRPSMYPLVPLPAVALARPGSRAV